jgi:hypothetical protein
MTNSSILIPPLADIAGFPNPADPPKRSKLARAATTALSMTYLPGLHRMLDKAPGPHFQFHKRRSGNRHAVIVINGFMTRGDMDVSDWERSILHRFGDASWYHLDWETTRHPKDYLADLLTIDGLLGLSRRAMATELLGAWHSTMRTAEQAGKLLAQAIARTPGWRFTLLGHSLGARVIHFALKDLAPYVRVDNVYLLGGAVGGSSKDDACWKTAASAVKDKIYNCYSGEDEVLRFLYQGANAKLSDPIGYSGIHLKHPRIVQHDATALVQSHTAWKQHFGSILERLHPSPAENR